MLMLKYSVQRQQEMVWMELTAAGRPPRREGDRPLPNEGGRFQFCDFYRILGADCYYLGRFLPLNLIEMCIKISCSFKLQKREEKLRLP